MILLTLVQAMLLARISSICALRQRNRSCHSLPKKYCVKFVELFYQTVLNNAIFPLHNYRIKSFVKTMFQNIFSPLFSYRIYNVISFGKFFFFSFLCLTIFVALLDYVSFLSGKAMPNAVYIAGI